MCLSIPFIAKVIGNMGYILLISLALIPRIFLGIEAINTFYFKEKEMTI